MAYVSTAEEGIVWSLDEKGEVWVLKTGSISKDDFVPNDELGWTHAPDALLIQVDVGYNSQVAGVDDEGVVYWRTGITDGNFGGDGWTTFEDGTPLMSHVTVCDTGNFWGTTLDHTVYMRGNVNDDTPMGDSWMEVSSDMYNLRQVSCGRRGWVVGRTTENRMVFRGEVHADNDMGNFWTETDDTEVKYVSIGIDGQIWAVAMDGTALMRTGVNDE
jgi:hypothetical protein